MVDILILAGLVVAVALQALNYFRNPTPGELAALKDFVYSLVLQAEAIWGGGTGEAKKALVVQMFYEKAPDWLRKLVKPAKLLTVIETAVTRMKQYFMANPPAAEKIAGGDGDG